MDDAIVEESKLTFVLKLTLVFFILMMGFYGLTSPSLIINCSSMLIIAAIYVHMIELQHELIHGLGLKNGKTNKTIGFLLGLPLMVNFADYQFNHMRHHKLIGTSENKEFFDYNRAQNVSEFIFSLFMMSHFKYIIINMCQSVLNNDYLKHMPTSVGKRVRFQYQLMLAISVTALLLTVFLQTTFLLYAWFLPLLIAMPLHYLVELPEHYGCDTATKDIFQNTRTIKSNRFMTWFTNGNNYHVEHHLNARIPISQLSVFHQKIGNNILHYNTGYWQFYKHYFAQLIKNGVF